jgi:hypothetical protein
MSDEMGTIQHIERYEDSLTRRAGTPRNHGPQDTRPIPSAKGANRPGPLKNEKGARTVVLTP